MTNPAAWGIDPGYEDIGGRWHPTPDATAEALLDAMGAVGGVPTPASVRVVAAGASPVPAEGRWELHTEDGGTLSGEGSLPPDLPLGYHRLVQAGRAEAGRAEAGRAEAGRAEAGDDREITLIVTPDTCHLPPGLRTWGWAVQLYALRSSASWGIGDLADLRRLGEWSAAQGAGTLLVNPLHASLPGEPQEPSPYYPSSRCFRNPLYLRLEDVAGAGSASGVDLDQLARQGRALNGDRRIDRDQVYRLKMAALEALWAGSGRRTALADPGFDRFLREQGQTLQGYSTFCALSENYGRPWAEWPAELRQPGSPAVARFARENADRVRFHQWLQWLADEQLGAASGSLAVMHDLAIGVDPAGADAWQWQDSLATEVRVGAPPDDFNTLGQDWGLPPFDPWQLREAAYEPFVRVLRATFRHAGAVRIDHIMGLFRLYWIPPGAGPTQGAYVRYPWRDLLAILALESQRAQAYVVGEDLGTVEPGVREQLAGRNVFSYRLLWFESHPPPRWPSLALGAVTTHDLPTIAGLWTGADLRRQEELGLAPNVEGAEERHERLKTWLGVDDGASVREVISRCHALLAQAPCAVVTATLDDALAVEERPNYPGTADEAPNWSLALPSMLEEIVADPGVAEVARTLVRRDAPMVGPAVVSEGAGAAQGAGGAGATEVEPASAARTAASSAVAPEVQGA